VTVVGGGGGGSGGSPVTDGAAGGKAGVAYVTNVPVSAPVTVTVGSGGTGGAGSSNGTPGGTSSFGPAVSCTGGSAGTGNGPGAVTGANGAATVSLGTALKTGVIINVPGPFGAIIGLETENPTPGTAIAYSSTSRMAGVNGGRGTQPSVPGGGGIGGAVVVEFVG
jgi:hypothetical protein